MKGKHIIVGITGSIAAYKACLLIRALIKEGAEVQVVITPAGKEFITPTTLSALTSRPVVSNFFTSDDGTWHSHIEMGLWADAMIIAPATASTIGKMRSGVADNILLTTYLSMRGPVFIAPAMDLDMYAHPSTQENLQVLKERGNIVIEPESGELASHLSGKGRLAETQSIIEVLHHYLEPPKQDLLGKRVLITAGPTYEKIDPVRFIGNFSTGKMGFALAEECAARGAKVDLLTGPVQLTCNSTSICRHDVMSAKEMYEKALSIYPYADIGIMAAAVADYTIENLQLQKIKRKGPFTLTLEPTKDIAAELGQIKKDHQILVGFALETHDEETHALEKLKKKNLDFIVLNSLRKPGTCFGYDTNMISIFNAKGEQQSFDLKTKKEVAHDIIDYLCANYLS